MSTIMLGYLGIAALLILMFSGIPIAFSFATIGFFGTLMLRGMTGTLGAFGEIPYQWASHYVLMAIPLFILMGFFASHAGISGDLYKAAHKWIGHLPGGMAIATTVASAMFAATSGSSLASSGAMGPIAITEMEKHGYDKKLAAGTVAAGGTLAILIPPSLAMVVYGALTEESVALLFIAGVLPGLLLSVAYCLQILIQVKLNPGLGPPGPKYSWRERLVSIKGTWMMLVLFGLLMGGIFGGVFTPTEAAAIGAFGAIIFTVLRRRLTKKVIMDSLDESGKTTCMIFMLYIGAMLFMNFLALTRMPYELAGWVVNLPINRIGILAVILFIYIPLGMVMDALSMLVLTLPIFYPIIINLGFDGVWFGILIVVLCELALITPPVGLNVFILKGVSSAPLYDIFKGIVPFAITDCIVLIILVAFPQISLFLPVLMKGH